MTKEILSKSSEDFLSPLYMELSIHNQEVISSQPLTVGESFPLVIKNEREFVIAVLDHKGYLILEVSELVEHKDKQSEFNPCYTKTLWDPKAQENDSKGFGTNYRWTRIGSLPFGITYNSDEDTLSWEEGEVRKVLCWT